MFRGYDESVVLRQKRFQAPAGVWNLFLLACLVAWNDSANALTWVVGNQVEEFSRPNRLTP